MIFFKTVVLLWSLSVAAGSAQPAAFSAALAQLLRSVRLPPARLRAVPRVLHDLERMLQSHWPGCTASLFGSIATGLAFHESDVDVTILLPNDTAVTTRELVTEASNIMEQRPGLFRVIEVILNTSTPIVIVKHEPTGFIVDVSFRNINGIICSQLLRYLLNLDMRVMDLALIVKYWAKFHGITRYKRLPSFGIIIMLVFFLQQKEILPPVVFLQKNAKCYEYFVDHWNMGFMAQKYWPKNDESLCTLLGEFFEYYTKFDFNKYIISAYAGRPIEIDLFRDLKTVPKEFNLYQINVGLNIKPPLRLEIPVVQDIFEHNRNLAIRVRPYSILLKPFQQASVNYQENYKFPGDNFDYLKLKTRLANFTSRHLLTSWGGPMMFETLKKVSFLKGADFVNFNSVSDNLTKVFNPLDKLWA